MSFGRKVNDCSNKGTDMGRGTRGERRRRLLAAALSGILLSEPFELVVGADGAIDAEDTSVAQGSGRTPGYYVSDDGLTIVAVDEPRPWSPPSTDDPDEPGTDNPGTDEPGTDEPEDPGTDEPGTEDPNESRADDPGSPDEPGNPEEPGENEPSENEPVTDDPSDPSNPGTDSPGTPTDPEAPTGPGDPGDPGAGDVPAKPGASATDNARPQTPDTGDRTNAALPVAVAFLAAALIAGALLVRRRMRE